MFDIYGGDLKYAEYTTNKFKPIYVQDKYCREYNDDNIYNSVIEKLNDTVILTTRLKYFLLIFLLLFIAHSPFIPNFHVTLLNSLGQSSELNFLVLTSIEIIMREPIVRSSFDTFCT